MTTQPRAPRQPRQPAILGQANVRGFAAELPSAGLKLSEGQLAVSTSDATQFLIQGSVKSGNGSIAIHGSAGLGATAQTSLTLKGSQFTAEEFTRVVLDAGCKLSMDGRGAWRDNVFVERLWRSVKYERVYLKAYDSVSVARTDIAEYLQWYNAHRAHSSLDRLTPDEAYFAGLPPLRLAA